MSLISATNVYFPKVPSAIDIPVASEGTYDALIENVKASPYYQFLRDTFRLNDDTGE